MKNLIEKIEATFAAVAFAEVGDHESALGFLQSSESDEEATVRPKHRKEKTHSGGKMTVREKLANHFTAAAFAEAGDFETARQMLLGRQRKPTVLLAIEGEVPNEVTFDYTINLCRRLNADMDILQMISNGCPAENGPTEALSALFPRLEHEGISFKVTVRMARADKILYDHVRIHRHVVTAVIDSPNLRNKEATETYWRETFRNITRKLSVPLVTALQRES